MKKRSKKLTYDQLTINRDILTETIERQDIKMFAHGFGPLKLSEIPEVNKDTPTFDTVSEVFGWPTDEDAAITPAPRYRNNSEFVDALVGKEGGRSELSNCIVILAQEPTLDPYQRGEPLEKMYARMPALHRLHALVPGMIQPAQSILANLRDEKGTLTKELRQELNLGVNDDLVTAIRYSYSILSRLLTSDDRRLQARVTYSEESGYAIDPDSFSDVTNAFDELSS